jgi:RNA polymerase subunit RPABC4/transcription elongation factor Spt4
MATYKQPCLHCGEFIARDSRLCPNCGSRSPFGYHCPTCLREIQKSQMKCSGCGRALFVDCPACHGRTFVGEWCDSCGTGLLIKCANPRCKEPQFFENEKCTACGKKIKKNKR